MRVLLTAMVACAVAACAAKPDAPVVASASSIEIVDDGGIAEVIRPEDQARIDALPATWLAAWGKSRQRGRSTEGALLEPDTALDHPELSPGSYNCRVIRLGRRAGSQRVRRFPTQFCHVGSADGVLNFTKQTGSELPAGHLYKAEKRYTFLGARQYGPGDNSLVYGKDRSRDVAGVVERVGPFRWRMVVPMSDQDLDVIELTPVPFERQGNG